MESAYQAVAREDVGRSLFVSQSRSASSISGQVGCSASCKHRLTVRQGRIPPSGVSETERKNSIGVAVRTNRSNSARILPRQSWEASSFDAFAVVEKTNSPSDAVREPIVFAFDAEFRSGHLNRYACPFLSFTSGRCDNRESI